MPSNVSSKAPMSVGRPEVVPVGSVATPQLETTAFFVQDLAQLNQERREEHRGQIGKLIGELWNSIE